MTPLVLPERAAALNEPLSSERLVYEPLTGAHAEELFAPLQHEAIYTWISASPPPSVETLRERWTMLERRLSPDGTEAWLNWVARRVSDGVCVGRLDVTVDAHDVATNVGYILLPAHWGMGYASEAVRAVAGHLEARGVRRLWATVTRGNDASARVLEKAGFVRTRVIPENDTIRGVKHDDIEYVRGA
jgi:RimJ/RimL family protein N-acetyltransferase